MGGFQKLTLFITGPTFVSERVKKAGLLPEFGHRDSENAVRFSSILANLRKMFSVNEDYSIVVIPGSGSNAMETSIRSIVTENDKVLNVSCGAFGDLYHKMALANGKNSVQLKFEPGNAIDVKILEDTLKQHKPSVVTITHNETSTGVVNDISEACKLIKKYGAMTLVDGVSIFGGDSVDMANIDMYSTSTQKCLGLPAGFGIACVSKAALEKAEKVKDKGYATDLIAHAKSAEKNQTLTTPNCTLANQMHTQLNYIINEEGIEKRFERHKKLMKITHKWVEGLPKGYSFFAQEGYRSPTVTSVEVPIDLKRLKEIKERLRAQGYLMDPGYGKLNAALEEQGKKLTLRIGHMGDITPEMLEEYLKRLSGAMK